MSGDEDDQPGLRVDLVCHPVESVETPRLEVGGPGVEHDGPLVGDRRERISQSNRITLQPQPRRHRIDAGHRCCDVLCPVDECKEPGLQNIERHDAVQKNRLTIERGDHRAVAGLIQTGLNGGNDFGLRHRD